MGFGVGDGVGAGVGFGVGGGVGAGVGVAVGALNRLLAPYRAVTPYRALTLFPLMEVIRYHAVPDAALAPQVVRQAFPVTGPDEMTGAPATSRAFVVAVVEALVLRFTPLQAAASLTGAT